MLLSRVQLPAAYRQEYVLEQEHFSGANLMLSLAAEHWRSPLSAAPPSASKHSSAKVLIFTRTSADMAKLGVGEEREMLQLLQAAATRAACGAPLPQQSSLCVLQLRGLESSAAVTDRLKAFLRPAVVPPASSASVSVAEPPQHQRLILLLADMSAVSAPQLNFVRQLVREGSTCGGRGWVWRVCLLHVDPSRRSTAIACV
jgi:hypothetical protein